MLVLSYLTSYEEILKGDRCNDNAMDYGSKLFRKRVIISYSVKMVAPPGLEPRSKGPEPSMLDRYTTGLFAHYTEA